MLHAKVLQNECAFSQWIVEFDGWEVLDEISKKPAAESPPYAAKVQAASTSAAVQPETNEQRAARRKAILMPMLQKNGWTLSQLVTAVGCGKNTIYRYVDGRRKTITVKTRQAIADELKVKLEQIPE